MLCRKKNNRRGPKRRAFAAPLQMSAPHAPASPSHTQVTLEELKKHNTIKDCWICIKGKVYDVSKFHDKHPGEGINDEYVHFHAGQDVSDLFEKYHFTDEPFKWLEDAQAGKMPEITYVGLLTK